MSNAFGLPDTFLEPDRFALDAPGVDLVATPEDIDVELTADAQRLIGALHRRFWSRRDVMVRNADPVAVVDDPTPAHPTAVDIVVDLTAPSSWDARLDVYTSLREDLGDETTVGASVRGWLELEPAVLVDGLAVPACVVDIAVVAEALVDALRAGSRRLVIDHPAATSDDEARLWSDLVTLVHDRLGIDRGMIECTDAGVTSNSGADETAVAAVA